MRVFASFLLAFCLLAGCSRSEPVSEISIDGSQPTEPVAESRSGADDWPYWRGPARNGHAQVGSAPIVWDETNNIVWKTNVPGRGHASPTVLGDRIFLATADENSGTQSVVCFDGNDGHQLWQTTAHDGGLPGSLGHQKSTHASCTVATDGERVFASFLNGDAIWVTSLDIEGEQLWQTKVGPFDSSYGYAASPAIYKSFVIVAADHNGGGFVAALHRKTGKLEWRKPRPAEQSYASPLVVHVAGKDQVLLCVAYLVASYDPNTRAELWSQEGTTKSCAGTMAYAGDLVYATGGYPDASVACYRADCSGELVWKNNKRLYVPSLLVHNGYVYASNDKGVAFC